MKKTISIYIGLLVMLFAASALAAKPSARSHLSVLPKNVQNTQVSERKAAIKVCNDVFTAARKAYANAVKKDNQDFASAMKNATDALKSSDKGTVAKKAFTDAKKTAKDTLNAAKKSTKAAWDAAITVHNQCVRQNSLSVNSNPSSSTATNAYAPRIRYKDGY